MGEIKLTNELLEYLGEKFEEIKTEEVIDSIASFETFQQFVSRYLRGVTA